MARFTIETTLEGFVSVGEPGGKYNNMTMAFRIPADRLPDFEADYEAAIEWAKSKVGPGRVSVEPQKWDEEGVVKYTFGGENGKPDFPFVDCDGEILSRELRASIRKGTKVRLIINLNGYPYGNKVGCSFKVLGAQVLELNSGAVTDSGSLSDEDVVALFVKNYKGAGYKVDETAPRAVANAEAEKEPAYDF
jgi:hypothetical protein